MKGTFQVLLKIRKYFFRFPFAQVVLGELIQLSEYKNNRHDVSNDSITNLGETTFIENPNSASTSATPLRTLTRQTSSDSKLEKKVTFARLLSKMSAEINGGTNIDVR